ncbi:polyprenyl synthetase family protein [Nocardia sp. NPDC088792]|uniref:polyprenyl synthetase family protein n=1 Tax=Nocardia sp. NPDC088792 TaxID=3364332 RepID=UPI0037FADF86
MPALATGSAVQRSSASRQLAQARALIDPILRNAVATLPPPLDVMTGYHFGWFDSQGSVASNPPGKALRPALTVAAAQACGGAPADVAHAAAAVELLHNFSLVHDDIVDADPIRHGRPTVWTVWGAPNAILVGDTLHALAAKVLVAGAAAGAITECALRLADATIELCRGQQLDCAFETRGEVTVGEYLSMSMGKTGALMGCACALGARTAGADAATVQAMDAFGRAVGIGFQLVDDVIGIWGDPELTGKPAGSDLARRKWTFPVVRVLNSGSVEAGHLARLYRAREPMSPADVATATRLLDAAGGAEPTLHYAAQRVAAAFESLPAYSGSAELQALAHRVAHRDR